jgi:hypothetical protein
VELQTTSGSGALRRSSEGITTAGVIASTPPTPLTA